MTSSPSLRHIMIALCLLAAAYPVSATQPPTNSTAIIQNIMGIIIMAPLSLALLKTCYEKIKEKIAPRAVQKIGVITIAATIEDSTTIVQQATIFFQNPSIAGILLKIDSPGGSAGASQAIYYALNDLKTIYPKPLVVYAENILASGAYYVACAADTIVTLPSTLVGSIGVIMSHIQLQELLEKISVKYSIITAGSYKATGNPFIHPLETQTALLQKLCDNTHIQFITDVEYARPQLTQYTRNLWADGQIFDGKRAHELGLIDQLGSQFTVIASLMQLTNNDDPIEWIYPEQPSAFELLLGVPKNFDLHASLAWLTSKLARKNAELRFQWCVPAS